MERQTESWDRSNEGFQQFEKRIQSLHSRNLLARRETRLYTERRLSDGRLRELVDGRAGQFSGEGRVMLTGTPVVLTYYLGQAKTITQIGAFTCNGDARANQDFEVRWMNNSENPGVMPDFSKATVADTGPVVLGANGGGFHTCFVGDTGAALVPEKADWIQFRIWQTYNVKVGEPAHNANSTGASAYIELEVLGDQDDIVVPTPEELAFQETLRKTPTKPELVRQATWFDTMVASFDALYEWECIQDRLALFNSDISLGQWYLLGPVPAKSEVVNELHAADHVDLAKQYADKTGQPLVWRKRNDLTDGAIHDLSDVANADEKDVFFLCREMTVWQPLEKDDFQFFAAADQGVATILPIKQKISVRNPIGLYRKGTSLTLDRGRYQVLLEIKQRKNGGRRFCFVPQLSAQNPGAGDLRQRQSRRSKLLQNASELFSSAIDQVTIGWEVNDEIWIRQRSREPEVWLPGHADEFLQPRYRAAIRKRLAELNATVATTHGVEAEAIQSARQSLAEWLQRHSDSPAADATTAQLRQSHHQLAALQEVISLAGRVHSMALSVQDTQTLFEERYANAGAFQKRIATLAAKVNQERDSLLTGSSESIDRVLNLKTEVDQAAREILLANPLLDFERLLVTTGRPRFSSNWTGANTIGDRIAILSPVGPKGTVTSIYEGNVSSMDLHWDGDRILFSDGHIVSEIRADGTGLRQVTPDDGLLRYDPCYLPDGNIVFASNACQQAVPCTGGPNVGNLHWIRPDGSGERRITFDQDHNWNPTILNDGRLLYSRWEYADAPHYFSRLLFRMNPDGSGQMEYYGSNSYWPNATYWPRPIPGHPTMVSCVVSGHHGVARVGEMVLLDPSRGRHEADGAVQMIPGYGKPVEPVTKDQLVTDVWPKFAAPYPLAEPGTNRGAGKYFLACVQQDARSQWRLCLVDVFDNITPIVDGEFMSPIPLRPRPMPPVIPSVRDSSQKTATVYLANIYQGRGLKDYPVGSIKRLRIGTHHYRYFGNGDTRASSLEGGWDVKRILGTVPVHEDGSALFHIPANTPIFVQPLDEEGKAQQIMRSWFTAMPGEVISCVGCHERQNDIPPSAYSQAALSETPDEITPWHGPLRGFSFEREVQPVLDRRCAGCHNDQPYDDGTRTVATIDLRAKRLRETANPTDDSKGRNHDSSSDYSPAYLALQQFVRRPGYESDYHMSKPAEYEADTSPLVRLLKRGHYNVQLTPYEWEQLYTWIDYNVPYPVNWRESHRPPTDEQVALRREYLKRFAGIDDHDEDPVPLPPIQKFEPPAKQKPRPDAIQLQGWPIAAEEAKERQNSGGDPRLQLNLGNGLTMPFMRIPAGQFVMGSVSGADDEYPQSAVRIERPFYMGQLEVTNAQYAAFDATHDSGVINERWKDRTRRGTFINQPDAPVVRVTWYEAMAYCEWLTRKTGRYCTLPTEAQWEWACRAGTDTPFAVSDATSTNKPFANIADETIRAWNHGRGESGYRDNLRYSEPGGRFSANAWGLYDMHGNVAEWCRSSYRSYPYSAHDGRDEPTAPGAKVVRGGSWNDTLRDVTSSTRWRYSPYKPVYNVGFRVIVEDHPSEHVAANQP